MKTLKNKAAAILISVLMITMLGTSAALLSNAHATTIEIPTYSYVNVAPNPCGVDQTVTVNFWLAVPLPDDEDAVNITVLVTNPSSTTTTLGPFVSDLTGGYFTTFTPTTTGNYTFQMKYGGQTLVNFPFTGDFNGPSESIVQTLIVQSAPATGFPTTPLPTTWWQTPVNSENVQNWASISGGWMGYYANTFAITGGYNETGNYNPYTTAPASAHILWTKPYCVGGVAGGPLGNDEANSNYWTTSQYDPKYAPVIMDGIEYTTWYTTQTGSEQGIMAINLYNGQTMWVINTTNALRCGMILNFKTIDQYGDVGPYIFTQGYYGMFAPPGPWMMYDGLTGQYLATITNTPSFILLGADSDGNIIGYTVATNTSFTGVTYPLTVQVPIVTDSGLIGYVTNTYNTLTTGPVIEMYNLTRAIIAAGTMAALGGLFDWTVPIGTVWNWNDGLQWAVPENAKLNGVIVQGLGTSAFSYDGWSGNTIVLEAGFVNLVGETAGWVVEAGFNANTGALQWIDNRTGGIYEPYTRITNNLDGAAADGVYTEINQATYQIAAYYLSDGTPAWTTNLDVKMADGHMPDQYDEFDFETTPDATTGVLYVWALGGDVWAVNMTNGDIIWSFSTAQVNGAAGTETPYGIYPLWTFSDEALAGQGSGTILYLSEGHEYDPPLFHGALELALNANTGQVVWDNLGFDDTATAVAYGIMTTFNAYDGQIYAYGQGPSKTTVSAPDIGVTTATPVTITGSVTDVSAGASQEAVAANFPNGLPCVSDASMTGFMEAVYEQQPMPTNVTGVPVQISVTDSNHNTYVIGTTTTNALGDYGLTWTPIITGNYTVYATFAGTAAYYGSSASTYFYANAPPATAPPYPTPVTGVASTGTVELGVAAIIIVIIIIGVVLAVLMLRKRP